ncbi:MAG: 50S ribosomal protein L25 [Chloroflexota bacterium]
MKQIELQADNRNSVGKGVKSLRLQGITPVHLFGHDLKSLALQCETAKLERSLAQAGESRLIALTVNNEKMARPVLVREIQRDALTGRLLHIDFYQVKMDENLEVEVPINLVGEAPALATKDNTLLQSLQVLTVKCLPAKIPASLEVNVSSLTETGQAVRVKDIAIGQDITVLTDPEQVVVAVIARLEEEIKEKETVEEVVRPLEDVKQSEEKPEQK